MEPDFSQAAVAALAQPTSRISEAEHTAALAGVYAALAQAYEARTANLIELLKTLPDHSAQSPDLLGTITARLNVRAHTVKAGAAFFRKPDECGAVRRPCGCWKCLTAAGSRIPFMIVCARCGNKRCPHANDHENPCTASNDTGQAGSAYEHGPGAASARRLGTMLRPDGASGR